MRNIMGLITTLFIGIVSLGWSHGNSYTGPCDLVVCAEAFSVARAQTYAYTGPLFQLYNGSTTLDVGQVNHKANMTTWSAFCSGVASNCSYAKIYAQINHTSNDLMPSVVSAPFGPNCSTGGTYLCAAPFAIEAATGLPIITTTAPQEYVIAGVDNASVGINGGGNSTSVVYNGTAIQNQFCCGVFGISHKYNAGDVTGTDFLVNLAYGQTGQGNWANCSTTTTYCMGLDEEGAGELVDYGSSLISVVEIVAFNSGTNTIVGLINGHLIFSHNPPSTTINTGISIHFGGGGDLGQPDPATMREGLIFNGALTSGQQTAILNNMTAFYSGISYP